MAAEIENYAKVVRSANIRLEQVGTKYPHGKAIERS